MNNHFINICNQYVLWLDTLGFSSGVVANYHKLVNTFLQWLHTQGLTQINELNQHHINTYFTKLQTTPQKRKPNTLFSIPYINHHYTAIDKLLEFLHQINMQTAPTPTNIRIKQLGQQGNIQSLTQAQIKTLYNTIPQTYPDLPFTKRQAKHYQLKLIFALYYGCGLRRSEGYKLTINDIDFDKKTIFIRQGKNYKDRIVPMSTGVYQDLQDYIYNYRSSLKLSHNRLFILCTVSLYKSLKHLQTITQQHTTHNPVPQRLYLHLFRHSIATHLLQNGMSIENIALFLGHSSLESTQLYTHIAEQQ